METNKRLKNSIKNSIFAGASQFITLIFAFITRSIFIKTLGSEYLGFDSLFSNILSVLSIVDLGIGTALNFSLYKPMFDDDVNKVAAIIQYFKKIFCIIGFSLLIVSIVLTPFLGYLVKDIGNNLSYMQRVFFLYAILSFSTYFFVDVRTLYFASQQQYKIVIIDTLAKIAIKSVQTLMLFVYPSYLLYLVLEIIINIFSNMLIKKKAKKEFRDVFIKERILEKNERKKIFEDVKYLSLGKLATVGVTSSDSIIIAKFVGTASLGAFSNYWLITGAASELIISLTNGIIASLGDLFVEDNKEKISSTFSLYNFINFQASSFFLICSLSLIQPFMYIWLNGYLLLDGKIVIVIIFNLSFQIMWNSIRNIVQTKGLFKKDIPIQISQVVLNIIISIFLVRKFGMLGVFLGTTISSGVSYILQSMMVIKKVFNKTFLSFMVTQLHYGMIALIQLVIIYITVNSAFSEYTFINFILRAFFVIFMFAISDSIFYINNTEFKKLVIIFKNILILNK